ncbi:hypothetical protein ACFQ36_04750 [Arthrobacter sp. GCM10027362]
MASESRTTIDHDEIRRWVGENKGVPASVKGTEKGGEASTFFKLVSR